MMKASGVKPPIPPAANGTSQARGRPLSTTRTPASGAAGSAGAGRSRSAGPTRARSTSRKPPTLPPRSPQPSTPATAAVGKRLVMPSTGSSRVVAAALGDGEEGAPPSEADWRVRVFCRLRPPRPEAGHADDMEVAADQCTVSIRVHADVPRHASGSKDDKYSFRFTQAFGMNASQSAVYNAVAKPVVLAAFDGFHGTVFAYGQTGSGKTFTITGGAQYRDRGIIPRALSTIFQEIKNRTDLVVTCRLSYLEIYNESVYDLLDKSNSRQPIESWTRVSTVEHGGKLHLRGVRVVEAATEEDALNALFLGNAARMTAETAMNRASSRSHCVFSVALECRKVSSDVVLLSKLHLVDLAGSERVGRAIANGETTVSSDQVMEGKYINLSLHYLQQVIAALQRRPDGNADGGHVPYRNSMLTWILRDSLGGNCRTVFLATVNSEPEHVQESLSTCRFAQRCGALRYRVIANEERDMALVVARLRQLVARLRQKLAAGVAAEVQKPVEDLSRQLTQGERKQCEAMVADFISNELDALVFEAVLVGRECCAILKNTIQRTVVAAAEASNCADAAKKRLEESRNALAGQNASIEEYKARILKLEDTIVDQEETVRSLDRALADAQATSSVASATQSTSAGAPAALPRAVTWPKQAARKPVQLGMVPPPVPELLPPQTSAGMISSRAGVYRDMLQIGAVFLKHGRHGAPHPRFVWVDSSWANVCWRDIDTRAARGTMAVDSITQVLVGHVTDVFKRHAGRPDRGDAAFSLVGGGRTLDLEVEILGNPQLMGVASEEKAARDMWVAAFEWLMSQQPGDGEGRDAPLSSEATSHTDGASEADRRGKWRWKLWDPSAGQDAEAMQNVAFTSGGSDRSPV